MISIEQISAYLVPSIVILCYLVGYILKNLISSEQVDKFIPLIVAVVGIAAAVFATTQAGAAVTLDVILGGAVSGLASTGISQVFKQLTKQEEYVTIPKGEDTTSSSEPIVQEDNAEEDVYESKHMRVE